MKYSVQLFTAAGITYSWIPMLNFTKFELAVSYKGRNEEYWLAIGPVTVYVAGDENKLDQLLAAWNRSENFRYERKINNELV